MSSQDGASLPSRWTGAAEAMPSSLDELVGPGHGVVVLLVDLAWSGRRSFDLADPDQQYLCYMAVLTSGVTREHYTRWLNADLLRASGHDSARPAHCVGYGRTTSPNCEPQLPALLEGDHALLMQAALIRLSPPHVSRPL